MRHPVSFTRDVRPTKKSLGLVIASLWIAMSCGEGEPTAPTEPPAPVPTSIDVSPTNLTFTALLDTLPLAATVRDQNGQVLAAPVAWRSNDPAVVLTTPSGTAISVSVGVTQLEASAGGLTATVEAVVTQVVASITAFGADLVLDGIGDTIRISAATVDANGASIPGAAVTWTAADPSVASVDRNGLVTAVARGNTNIRASSGGFSDSLTVRVEPLATSVGVSVQPAGAAAGQALGVQPVVEIRDGEDARVDTDNTTQVTATLVSGAGRLIGDSVVTAATGTATFETLGIRGQVGTYVIEFKSTGLQSATSPNLELEHGRATQLAITTQPGGSAAGSPFSAQPVVHVRDLDGNLVDSDDATTVSAVVASGPASLSGSTSATAQSGVASFTDLGLAGTVGPHALRFEASGLSEVESATFDLDAGPAASLAATAGDNQTGLAATQLPLPLSVTLSDAFGNPVEGEQVGWEVVAGTGSVSTIASMSDTAGVAENTLTLGRFAGLESVTATAVGLPGSPVTFNATATPNGRISGTVTISNQLLAASGQKGPAGVAAPLSVTPRPAPVPIGGAATDTPSRTPPRGTREPEYVENEILVRLRPGAIGAAALGSPDLASVATARSTADAMRRGLAPYVASGRLRVLGVSPAIHLARVEVTGGVSVEQVIAELERDASIESARRHRIDQRVDKVPTSTRAPIEPGDPWYPFQAWHYAMIDLPEAWDITTGSQSVVVAVLDDGIRFDHASVTGNLTNDGYDFVNNDTSVPFCAGGTVGFAVDGDGYDPDPTIPADYNLDSVLDCIIDLKTSGGHGLHVSGTIGGVGNDGIGGSGVNWNVRIRPVRVCGARGCANYDVAQGILYAAGLPADDGADGLVQAPSAARVINMSLGGPSPDLDQQDAVIAATNAGALIVASAGNDPTSEPNYPAAYPQTLSVSAVGPDRLLASYSSFGSTVDIAAPGGDQIDGGASFGVWSSRWNFVAGTPLVDSQQGTSMAAPHVSGVAALILSQEPSLSVAQLRSRLTDFAVDVGAPGRDDQFGAGILNARNSLTSSFAPPADLFAQLVNARTGQVLETVSVAPNGQYTFEELPDGDYWVYAGQDRSGDREIGSLGRRWGAFGGSATPSPVTVSGAGDYPATFAVGYPIEVEPNGSFAQPDILVLGGHLLGTISDPATDGDLSLLRIPEADTYTIETRAVAGACGFALEEDTVLTLFNANQVQIATNDDIDAAAFDFCSRITIVLQPGDYFVGVSGRLGRQYSVTARQGS